MGFTSTQWGVLLILAAVNFTHILDFVIVMPLGDQLRRQLHVNPQQFGVIVSAYGLAAMIVGIVSSTFVDRFDRKHVMLVAFGGFAVTTFYCGFAPNYVHLLTARSLAGLFGGLASAVVMAIIGDVFQHELRGKAIGVVTSSFAVASIVGLPTGLWLANHYGTWNAPFLAIGALAVLVWGATVVVLPNLTDHRKAEHPSALAHFWSVVGRPRHLLCFAFMLATVFGTFIIVPFIAPYMQANCGLKPMDVPVIYAIAGGCTLVWMNLVGWATDRFGAKPLFLFCAGGAVCMTFVITNLPVVSLSLATLVTTAFMVLASGRMVPAQTMILASTDPSLRGAVMNLNSAVSHFATAVGPVIAGSVIGEVYPEGPLTGFPVAGWIAAGFGCVAIGLSTLMRRYQHV